MTTVKLIAPTGATVSVPAEKVDNLLRRGFTEPKTAKKAPAKKAASSIAKKS